MGVLTALIYFVADLTSFQLVRINPSGGVLLIEQWVLLTTRFQLVRINPSGGVF